MATPCPASLGAVRHSRSLSPEINGLVADGLIISMPKGCAPSWKASRVTVLVTAPIVAGTPA